jgi:hypothetical protein
MLLLGATTAELSAANLRSPLPSILLSE